MVPVGKLGLERPRAPVLERKRQDSVDDMSFRACVFDREKWREEHEH